MLSQQPSQDNQTYLDPLNYTPSVDEQKRGFFRRFADGWFRLTAPPQVAPDADLADREIVRRGRLASIILVFALFNTLIGLPAAFFYGSFVQPTILLTFTVLEFIAFGLNRRKMVALAGLICVAGLEIGLGSSILGDFHVNVANIQNLDLLVMPLIYAASLLPAGSVFLVAIINSIFFVVFFNIAPHTPEVQALIRVQGYSLLFRPITMQVVVAVVTNMWVRSAVNAIVRADRADAIIVLTRTLARKDRAEAEQKQALEAGINDIVQVISHIAQDPYSNIDIDSRKPLWQIVAAINNLRKRLVRVSQESDQNFRNKDQMLQALYQLSFCLQQNPGQLISWQSTGTPVDEIVRQLVGILQQQPKFPQPTLRKSNLRSIDS